MDGIMDVSVVSLSFAVVSLVSQEPFRARRRFFVLPSVRPAASLLQIFVIFGRTQIVVRSEERIWMGYGMSLSNHIKQTDGYDTEPY